jgi:hypothetical protein
MKKKKKKFEGAIGGGWEENWSVMHTFLFFFFNPLSLSSIALFPNNKTHTYTTVDMLLALVLWAYLELFFFPLSRDAITTVVDQSLKSLRIVSYIYIYFFFFFVILFLPVRCCCCSSSSWSSHLFFLYDSVVVVKGVCCWCVILYSMYHCLSFFLVLRFIFSFVSSTQDPLAFVRVTSFHVQCSTLYN